MNRNEQEYYRDIKRIADALEKIANKPEQPRKLLKDRGITLTKTANRVNYIQMNKELHKDIKRVAIALEKLVKLMTKLMKQGNG